jgi:hypothetical protein
LAVTVAEVPLQFAEEMENAQSPYWHAAFARFSA